MSTKREGLIENRNSFEEQKNKEIFEATIDKNKEKVAEKKESKEEKRNEREHK